MHWWYNSRREFVDCLNHRAVEIVETLPLQSPVEGGTNTSAYQPKLYVIRLTDHRVLGALYSAVVQQRLGESLL